ncbi:MAG: hypothetical protein K0U98_24425 [Deltaproteobacteria bacterium]|nr:hypothetical protein [Deltaproteobacteria bacterium]
MRLRSFTCWLLVPLFGGTGAAFAAGDADLQGLSRPEQEARILTSLSRGEDVSASTERLALEGASRRAVLPPRSEAASRVGDALIRLQQVVAASADSDPDSLVAAYQAFEAQDLLVRRELAATRATLERLDIGSEVLARQELAEGDYFAASDRLHSSLGAAVQQLRQAQEDRADSPQERAGKIEAARSRLRQAARDVSPVLALQQARQPVSLLRAAPLPYRRSDFGSRVPQLPQTIQPSYLDPLAADPVPEDLAPTLEAPLSEMILRQAQSLGYDAVRVFEFVRNSMATEFYSSSMKGAEGTLRQGSGNDVDQASLLIALLRASQVPARYVRGVVELPVEELAAELGLADPTAVPAALGKAGLAFRPVIRGGRVAAVEMEQTWVSAFVPYTNYRGAVVDYSGRTWVPLAPAMKRTARVAATGVLEQMGFTPEAFLATYLEAPQISSPLAQLRLQVEDFLQTEAPGEVYEGQLGSREVVAEELRLLPSSLPMKVLGVSEESPALGSSEGTQIRLVVRAGPSAGSPILLDLEVPLARWVGQRVTLSYTPATVEDHRVVNAYGGLFAVPVYLVRLRPQVKIGGRAVEVGEGVLDMGVPHLMELQLTGPWGSETVSQTVFSGSYHALAVGAQQALRPDESEEDPADTERLGARLLAQLAHGYAEGWDAGEGEWSGLLDVEVLRPLPSVVFASLALEVEQLLGLPYGIEFEGVTLDAALRAAEPVSRQGDGEAPRDFMRLSALQGSALENLIFQQEYQVEGISADKGLGLARQAGIEVVRLDSSNLPTELPTLAHPQVVKNAIDNWVRLGLEVEVPRTVISLNAWTGSVWRAEDPVSGAAGYFIAGGLAGGSSSQPPANWVLDFLAQALASPYSAEPNTDPLAAVQLVKIPAGDGQTGVVDEEFDLPLAVQARDRDGRPVVGAEVVFAMARGGGLLKGEDGVEAANITVLTNALGIAEATMKAGTDTSANPWYVRRNGGDTYLTQGLMHFIEAFAGSSSGTLVIREPFSGLAYPGDPVALRRTDPPNSFGAAGLWSDTALVAVEDSFGNPVSNVDVTFSRGSASFQCSPAPENFENGVVFDASVDENGNFLDCGVRSPVLGDCGSPSLNMETSRFGAAAGFILGNSTNTTYSYQISASGLPTLSFDLQAFGGCGQGPSVIATTSTVINANGQNINAAKAGSVSNAKVPVTLFYSVPDFTVEVDGDGKCFLDFQPSRTWVRTTAQVSYSVSNGGSSGGVTLRGDGSYEASIRTGLTPGENEVSVDASDVRVEVATVDRDSCVEGTEEGFFTLQDDLSAVFGLSPEITGVVPDPILLTDEGLSATPVAASYQINPGSYNSNSVELDLFEGGSFLGAVVGDSRTGAGMALLPRGVSFDIAQTYEAEVVVNRGSVVEVRGDRMELPLFQRIFTNVSGSVVLQQEVDLLNDRNCEFGSEFFFETTQEANITLRFRKIDGQDTDGNLELGAGTTLIDDEVMPEGEHSLFISPADLLPGEYLFFLEGVSTVDGHMETRNGGAVSQFKTRNNLPVGHAMYKGVDLFDGALLVSRQDLAIPGRGVSLEFQRSYSSNGGMEAGPFGVGWNHSYDSKLFVTPCGEVIVAGAAGAGMTFVDDGAGGLRPLKGYHGTLIAEPSDNSFDFYSVDGTRYHYSFRRSSTWDLDYIEDVNGNMTDLTYDTSGRDPKLMTVEDAAGRFLSFTYERRSFVNMGSKEVIVSVIGPGGVSMTYDYDDDGNLISAQRENGVLHETYGYPATSPTSFDDRHRLTSTTDEVKGATTTITYEEGTIGLQGSVSVPRVFVASLEEPEGGVSTFTYDMAGLSTRGPPMLVQRVRDRRGQTTTYTLNQYGSPLSIEDPEGDTVTMVWSPDDVYVTSQTDANGSTTTFTYDDDANLLTESVSVTDVNGGSSNLTITHTYHSEDSFGRPGIKNRVASTRNRNGVTTTFDYDGRGNLTNRTIQGTGYSETHTYDSNGDRRSTTDPLGKTTTFTFDGFGNLASVTDSMGGTSSTTWDDRGRALQQSDNLGRNTVMDYDALNRVVAMNFPGGDRESTTFDDAGRVTTFTDAAGRSTMTRFDLEGRAVQVTNALGDSKYFDYDLEGNKILESNWSGATALRADTTFSYDDSGRLTTRTEPEGRVTTYSYDGEGNVLTQTLSGPGLSSPQVTENVYDELARRHTVRRFVGGVAVEEKFLLDGEGNTLEQINPLGRKRTHVYDDLDRLVSVTDALNNVTQFTYDNIGNKTEEEDALGRRRRTDYDALGRVIRTVDALNNTTLYEYDAVGNLVRELDPRLTVTEHQYDNRDRRVSTTRNVTLGLTPAGPVTTTFSYDPVWNQTRIQRANGNVVNQTFDDLDRVVTQTDNLGTLLTRVFDSNDNLLEETDANGNTKTFEYDQLNRLVLENLPEGRSQSFTYDAAGKATSTTDPNGFVINFEYDELDRQVRTVDPASVGTFEVNSFDLTGNLVSTTDRRGNTTTFQLDDLNRVTQIDHPMGVSESFTYDAVGNQITATDRRGIVTTYAVDGENRILSVVRAGQTVRELEYDANGNVRFDKDGNGNITGFEYDERNLKVAENRPLAAITRFGLDAMGNQIRERDPEGRIRTWQYDLRQRVSSMTDGAGETTTFTYDDNGNQKTITKPETGTWSRDYDGANRLVGITDPLGNETSYGYDNNDNRTTITDGNTRVSTMEYDPMNRLTAVVYPDGERTERDYDGEGNVIETRDAKGQVVTFTFDALGRQTASNSAAAIPSTGDDLVSQVFTYDDNNNLESVTENYGGGTGTRVSTFTFDDFDRQTSATDPQGEVLQYDYDGNGNRQRLTDADGRVTTYGFDALNRVTSVTIPLAGVTTYSYFRNSRLKRISYPNGTASEYQYDGANRAILIENTQGAAAVSTFEYTYDGNGNRLQQIETNGGAAETTTYVFDLADRLTGVNYPDKSTAYTYDAVGNRETERDLDLVGTPLLDKSFDYDLRNRLTTVTDLLDASQNIDYDFDANGNQIRRTQDGVVLEFLYDVRDQLTELTRDGVVEGRYLYDHQGLRVRKVGGGDIHRYVYDDQSVLQQTDDAGNTIAKYDYGPDRLLSMVHATEGRQFYLFDVLGSIADLTRPDGGVQARYKYDAWGNPRSTVGASFNPFGFTGHERDDETGLYYFKARFYDPETGRFLTEDPAEGDVDTPPSLHKYLYAHANPTVMVDPDGRVAETVWDVASLGLGITSLVFNVSEGNWGSAALDAFGVVVDAAATAVPFIPGGAGVAIKAGRAAKAGGDAIEAARAADQVKDTIDTLQRVDAAANAVVSADAAAENFENGEYGWGTFNAAMAVVGARQATRTNAGASPPGVNRADDAASANKAAPEATPEVKQNAIVTGEKAKGGTNAETAVRTKSAMAETSLDAPPAKTPEAASVSKVEGESSLGKPVAGASGSVARSGDGASSAASSGGSRGGDGGASGGGSGGGSTGGGGGSGGGRGPGSSTPSGGGIGSWNEFQAATKGQFASRAEAGVAWKVYKESNRAGNTLVIGRNDDTAAAAKAGFQRLFLEDGWTENVNDAWIQGAIDAGRRFKLVSPVVPSNLRNPPGSRFPSTVFRRELQQLKKAGYTIRDGWAIPPGG